jgi:hypothetical protein
MSAVAVQIVRKVSTLFGGRLSQSINASSDHLHILGAVATIVTFLADLANQHFAYVLLPICILAGCATLIAVVVPDWEDIEPVKVAHAIVLFGAITVLSALVYISKEYLNFDPTAALIGKFQQETDQHFKEMDSKLERIRAALAPSEQRQIQIASLTTDVSVSILVALHVIVDQRASTLDSTQQNNLFLQKANEYARLERSLAEFRPADPRAQAIVQQAKDALAHGDFPTALEGMRQAGETERSSSLALETLAHNRAVTAARALETSAAIARVSMRYDEAVTDLSGAAKLAAAYDPRYARQLTTAKADTLLQQGNEVGDQAAITQAADIYRSVLSMAGGNGADVAGAQSGLDQALSKLGGRSDGTGFQGGLPIENVAPRQREQLPALNATRAVPAGPTPSVREVRTRAQRTQAQLQPNTPLQPARSLQRRRTQAFVAAGSRYRRAPSTGATAITTVPDRASEASPPRASSESGDQPGLFGRLKHWATGSASSPTSSPSSAVSTTRPASGVEQLFRPSSVEEQRSLVSGAGGQTRQSNTASARHRKHSTN